MPLETDIALQRFPFALLCAHWEEERLHHEGPLPFSDDWRHLYYDEEDPEDIEKILMDTPGDTLDAFEKS